MRKSSRPCTGAPPRHDTSARTTGIPGGGHGRRGSTGIGTDAGTDIDTGHRSPFGPRSPFGHRRRRARPLAALALAFAGLLTVAPAATAQPSTAGGYALSTAVVLPGEAVYPESITRDPDSGDLYVSSFGSGTVYRAAPGQSTATVFLPAGTDGRTAALGVVLDHAGRLWVADSGGATVYDTVTGGRLARFTTPDPAQSLVNGLTTAPDGSVYLTDSLTGSVYRVTPAQFAQAVADGGTAGLAARWDLSAILPRQPAGTARLNGVVAAPNGAFLLVVDQPTGTLYRLDPATGAVRTVSLCGPAPVYGDGMHLEGGTLWIAQMNSDTISRLGVSATGRAAVVEAQAVDADLRRPTALVRGDGALYVTRSQFGLTAPDPVFTVAAVTGF
ncbi:SMP-30/gluconolactonase/LRE family protein [Streptomyces sp. MS06]|uniref:SMP-30/gluconolactonase/LRE family protein n=1 Tax=Streptomyces sp. MS06 TaxID=3385974 RepID=UPI0039A06886